MDTEAAAMKDLFSKENPQMEDVLRCFFDLKVHEIEAFTALHGAGQVTGERLAELLGKDKSGVHRTLQSLVERGLAEREYRLLRSGGYVFLYRTLPAEKMRGLARAKLRQWHDTISGIIEHFED